LALFTRLYRNARSTKDKNTELTLTAAETCKYRRITIYKIQGDQKVSVHLMITIQKVRCTETF